MVVNSDADTNDRDSDLTFREALLVTQGKLALNVLTLDEAGRITGPLGPGDTIRFEIGNAPQTIFVMTPLPAIDVSRVTVNGDPTHKVDFAMQRVTLDGTKADMGVVNGLTIGTAAGGTKVWGVTIENFSGHGILVDKSAGNTIGNTSGGQENPQAGLVTVIANNKGDGIRISGAAAQFNTVVNSYIGVAVDGSKAAPNATGIQLFDTASSNNIGSGSVGDRNVISGNTGAGILVGAKSNSNTIAGNYVGTDADGKLARPNGGAGVFVAGNSNKIGTSGTTVVSKAGVIDRPSNVISGNKADGVLVAGLVAVAEANTVEGNFIGLGADGSTKIGNGSNGVTIFGFTKGTVLGFDGPGGENVISSNGPGGRGAGVVVEGASTEVVLVKNFIGTSKDPSFVGTGRPNTNSGVDLTNAGSFVTIGAKNVIGKNPKNLLDPTPQAQVDPGATFFGAAPGLGIDIADAGVTAAGAPVLLGVQQKDNFFVVNGTLTSTPNAAFTVVFYLNAAPNASGYGEGEFYVGQANLMTDASGFRSFEWWLEKPSGDARWLSAFALGRSPANLGTSEFAQALYLPLPPAQVAGRVWFDGDADGLQDADELSVQGVTVSVYTSSGTLVASTTTDLDGNYHFGWLDAGSYYVQFTAPNGTFFTSQDAGSDDTLDSDAAPFTGRTADFTLASPGILDLDAGLQSYY